MTTHRAAILAVSTIMLFVLSCARGAEGSSADLLTADFADRECVGQNATDAMTLRVAEAGVYTLAVGRDWGSSAGATSGTRKSRPPPFTISAVPSGIQFGAST